MIKSGVPWRVAWGLPNSERRALAVRFGILEGNEYDFETNTWVDPEKRKPMKGKNVVV